MLSACPFVSSFICYENDFDVLKTIELILMPQMIHGAKAWNDQLLESGGQRSRPHKAEK